MVGLVSRCQLRFKFTDFTIQKYRIQVSINSGATVSMVYVLFERLKDYPHHPQQRTST
jgi:hypothetical protein